LKTRQFTGVKVHQGSDNIFADLGLPDAEKLMIKANLVVEIQNAIRRNGLSQTEAAKRMGIGVNDDNGYGYFFSYVSTYPCSKGL
jgi:hypothetical protein